MEMRCAGRALPLCYDGAAESFFEALERSAKGDILVLDNDGRLDQSCMGDVMASELRGAGLGGLVIWGVHRDSEALVKMGWPIFSLGTNPYAMAGDRVDAAYSPTARCGSVAVSANDFVICDCDGVIFIDVEEKARVIDVATSIAERESMLISSLEAGSTLRRQLGYDDFLRHRTANPSLRFSEYVKDRYKGN